MSKIIVTSANMINIEIELLMLVIRLEKKWIPIEIVGFLSVIFHRQN